MSAQPKKPTGRGARQDFAPDGTLSEAAAKLALAAPAATAPSPAIRARLLARVRTSCATESSDSSPAGWRFDSAHREAGWRGGVYPGVRFKTLSVDATRDVVMLLIEIAPGARFPDHLHDAGGDEGIVLSGDVETGGRLLKTGDYYQAAEGTAHVGTVSPSGCTALVSMTARAWKQWRAAMASA